MCQDKKYGPNERTDQSPEKIQLSGEEISNISDTELKTLVIRMLTEMAEYGHKVEGKVKAMQSGIKENVKQTNSDRKATRTQMNILDQKEEINIKLKQNEETSIQKK